LAGGPNLIDNDWSDGVHWKTDAEGALVSGCWDAVLSGLRSPKVKRMRKTGADKITLTFDYPLNVIGGGLSPECFVFESGTVTAATTTSETEIEVEFSAAVDLSPVTIFPLETAISATVIATGDAYTLPVTIAGVSSVVLPVDPVQSFENQVGHLGSVVSKITSNVTSKVTGFIT
jgi:hypothetical protein